MAKEGVCFVIAEAPLKFKGLYTTATLYDLSMSANICPICGLLKDLCVCGEISKEQQKIRIRLEARKFGRPMTIVNGINDKDVDFKDLAQKLKRFCAAGGTAKNKQIMLQGDQREKVRQCLIKLGYPEGSIELQ